MAKNKDDEARTTEYLNYHWYGTKIIDDKGNPIARSGTGAPFQLDDAKPLEEVDAIKKLEEDKQLAMKRRKEKERKKSRKKKGGRRKKRTRRRKSRRKKGGVFKDIPLNDIREGERYTITDVDGNIYRGTLSRIVPAAAAAPGVPEGPNQLIFDNVPGDGRVNIPENWVVRIQEYDIGPDEDTAWIVNQYVGGRRKRTRRRKSRGKSRRRMRGKRKGKSRRKRRR